MSTEDRRAQNLQRYQADREQYRLSEKHRKERQEWIARARQARQAVTPAVTEPEPAPAVTDPGQPDFAALSREVARQCAEYLDGPKANRYNDEFLANLQVGIAVAVAPYLDLVWKLASGGKPAAPRLCACGCGEPITSGRPEAKYATGACRVRAHRARPPATPETDSRIGESQSPPAQGADLTSPKLGEVESEPERPDDGEWRRKFAADHFTGLGVDLFAPPD